MEGTETFIGYVVLILCVLQHDPRWHDIFATVAEMYTAKKLQKQMKKQGYGRREKNPKKERSLKVLGDKEKRKRTAE